MPEPAYIVEDDNDWSDYPLAGRTESPTVAIPRPGTGRGMWMILVIVAVNAIIGFAIQMAVGDRPFARNHRHRGALGDPELFAQWLMVPISFLVMAGLLAAMLPTRFGRGCLVALYCFLICIGVAIGLAVPVFALGFVFRAL